eukprot:m.39466 g.39466  ORF g.39466 m.39466 type:complete len:383 (-) comp12676_c1_seq7:76-1224(-)
MVDDVSIRLAVASGAGTAGNGATTGGGDGSVGASGGGIRGVGASGGDRGSGGVARDDASASGARANHGGHGHSARLAVARTDRRASGRLGGASSGGGTSRSLGGGSQSIVAGHTRASNTVVNTKDKVDRDGTVAAVASAVDRAVGLFSWFLRGRLGSGLSRTLSGSTSGGGWRRGWSMSGGGWRRRWSTGGGRWRRGWSTGSGDIITITLARAAEAASSAGEVNRERSRLAVAWAVGRARISDSGGGAGVSAGLGRVGTTGGAGGDRGSRGRSVVGPARAATAVVGVVEGDFSGNSWVAVAILVLASCAHSNGGGGGLVGRLVGGLASGALREDNSQAEAGDNGNGAHGAVKCSNSSELTTMAIGQRGSSRMAGKGGGVGGG